MKRTDRPHIDLQIACCGPGAGEKLNLDGDQQSDLMVHGGVDKAVYVYPSEFPKTHDLQALLLLRNSGISVGWEIEAEASHQGT